MTKEILPDTLKFQKRSDPKKSLAQQTLKFIYTKTSAFWKKERQDVIVRLFHSAAKHIPAYKDYLKKNKIQKEKIHSYDELSVVPAVNKNNYLRNYPLEKLCVEGSLTQALVFTSTSGSTGAPFYFPRNHLLDFQSSIYHQMFLRNSKIDLHKSTLVLVCFGMGIWIGGLITYQAFKSISERGYPLTILTPGVNKKEIYDALKNIGKKFDQVILCGYPPFMKDVVDDAKTHDVVWKDYKDIKFIFAAEGFSEKFRDYIIKKTGVKNEYRDTMNIYGSADLGTMAVETPLTILIRRIAVKHRKLFKSLFGEAYRLPTLTQFNPDFISFEEINGRVFCTGNNALPLIRYEIGDNGGVLDLDRIREICAEEGVDLDKEIKEAGIEDTIAQLPFVYIYERTDLSTKLYGAIIYPEYVRSALQNFNLEKYITGKFTMYTKHDEEQNEYLEINIELKSGINESDWLKSEVAKCINDSLLEKSAEHKNNVSMMADKVKPHIVFWPNSHPQYFQSGSKQKWVLTTVK